MSQFEAETAVTLDGAGRWRSLLDAAWNIGTNPNGGYALTPVVRAARELADKPDPLAVNAHFLRPALAATDAVVTGRLLRAGRSTATVTASLAQDGAERLVVVATFGDVTTGVAEPAITPPAPDLPPPEECVPRSELRQGVDLPIASRLDVRVHPDDATGTPGPVARVRGWIRFRDGTPPDCLALPLFADAFPPALFTALGPVGWVPTVELTVHVRRRPVPGWIRASLLCDDLAGGRMVESGTLWDDSGQVVARSRQLGLLLTE